jgi:hypothetical protein
VCSIQESEVKDALKRMKGGKMIGLDEIPIEVWRICGDIVIVWLTSCLTLSSDRTRYPMIGGEAF